MTNFSDLYLDVLNKSIVRKTFLNNVKEGAIKNRDLVNGSKKAQLLDEYLDFMEIFENNGRPLVQKDFGDVQLLFRRVQKDKLAEVPEAEVVK